MKFAVTIFFFKLKFFFLSAFFSLLRYEELFYANFYFRVQFAHNKTNFWPFFLTR